MSRIWALLGLGLVLASPAVAREMKVGGLELDLALALQSTTWHFTEDDESVSRNEQSLELKLHTDPGRRWQVVTWVDLVGGSEVPRVQLQGVGVAEENDRFQIRSDAAYLDITEFPIKGMDIRIGRQVLIWGAADVFNPTDSLSAKSFENPIEFGQNYPSPAVNLHYQLLGFDLNAIYVDKFQAPRLPPDVEQQFFSSGRIPAEFQDLAAEFFESDGDLDLTLRADVPSDPLWGVRVSRQIDGFDVSLSYADTRDSIPTLGGLVVSKFDPAALEAEVDADLFFPAKKVYGFDLAGQLPFLGHPGIWAEVGWNVPESALQSIEFLGQPLSETEILTEPYLRYTVGGDYTVGDGYLVQAQLVRGFFDETSKDLLASYLVAGLDKSYFTDTFRVRFFEMYSLTDGGLLLTPDLLWSATDHLQVGAGGIVYTGRTGSKFEAMPTGDQFFLKLRYAF